MVLLRMRRIEVNLRCTLNHGPDGTVITLKGKVLKDETEIVEYRNANEA